MICKAYYQEVFFFFFFFESNNVTKIDQKSILDALTVVG